MGLFYSLEEKRERQGRHDKGVSYVDEQARRGCRSRSAGASAAPRPEKTNAPGGVFPTGRDRARGLEAASARGPREGSDRA